jgi:hypothetical protein
MEYYSIKKKNEITLFCKKMDETVDHHVEHDKPSSKSQISHAFACFRNLDLK